MDICLHLNVSISTLTCTYYSRPYPGREYIGGYFRYSNSAVDRRLDTKHKPKRMVP